MTTNTEQLPSGWRWESLEKIAAAGAPILYGILQPGPDMPDGVPYVRPTEIVEDVIDLSSIRRTTSAIAGKYKRSVLKPDDIILSIVGTIGKVAVVPPDLDGGNITQSSVRVRPRPDVVLPRYVAWVLRSPVLRRQFDKHRLGTAVPRLNVAHVRALRFPVPPLPEQRRIVAEIEKQFTRLEAGVAALRRVQANLKRYRAAVLKAACEGKLVKGDVAKWKTEKLGQLVTIRYGKMLATKELSRSGFPVFGANGIIGHHTRFLYEEEQVLISCRGAYSGKINLSPPQCFITNNSLVLELPEKPQVTKRFLFYALQAVDKSKMVTGSAQPQVTINNAEVADVPVPPLAKQTRIVAEVERRLSVVEELESVVTANLQRAIRLRQSILHKAFAGELMATMPAIQISNIIPPLKPEHINRPNSHFARAVLSAEIVHRLYIEPTFGRIKHQKIFHLCEHIAQIEEIHGQYHREAAGPLDNKLIYANGAELKKQKWYQEVRRESYGHAYQALAKAGGHRKYVERYWADKLPLVEKLIELMRKWDTERCEIFCTAYAAWNDLILWGKQATEDNILHEILERWHDSKKRFPKDRWLKAIAWMKKEGFVPTGFGKPTKEAK